MAIQIYRDASSPCIQIARHAILANSISILLDVLLHSLQVSDIKKKQIVGGIWARSISHLIYAYRLNVFGLCKAIKMNRIGKTFQGHSHRMYT